MESLNQSQYNCKVGRDWREDGDPDVPVLRDVCATKLLNTPIHLGSQDVVKSKYRFKEMKGVSSHLLPSYLDERVWRDRWGNCGKQAFGNILEHIAEQNLHL